MIGPAPSIGVMMGLAAMQRHQDEMNTSMERLATGKRINRASDDPAGMITSTKMDGELRSISKQIDDSIYEDKRLGAIDGAQGALSDLLVQLNGLVVHAANKGGTSEDERKSDQDQVDGILKAIDHVSESTTFEGVQIVQYLSSSGLGIQDLGSGRGQNLIDGDAEQAQKSIQSAIDNLSTQRAGLGIREQDVQRNVRELREKFENLSQAHSQIVDTDYAAETAKMMRASVLREVAAYVTQIAQKQDAAMVTALLG